MRGQFDGLFAVDPDGALAGVRQAHDGAHGGGAASAVAAQQRDHFTLVHGEIHAVQDVRLAVPGVEVFDLEKFLGHSGFRRATPERAASPPVGSALHAVKSVGVNIQCAPTSSVFDVPM